MSTTVMMAACGALIVAGVLGLIAGLRPTPVDLGRPGRASILGRRWSRRPWTLIAVGAVIGMVIATLTGLGSASIFCFMVLIVEPPGRWHRA